MQKKAERQDGEGADVWIQSGSAETYRPGQSTASTGQINVTWWTPGFLWVELEEACSYTDR